MPRDFKPPQTNPQKRLHGQQQTDPYQCRERWISCLHFHEILSRKNSLTWQSFISKGKKYSGKYFLWCSKSFQELLFLTSRLSLGEATWYYSLFTSKMCQVTKGHFQKILMVLTWAWGGNLLLLLYSNMTRRNDIFHLDFNQDQGEFLLSEFLSDFCLENDGFTKYPLIFTTDAVLRKCFVRNLLLTCS